MKEKFLGFMTSPKGRAGRVIAGLIILGVGMFAVKGTVGTIMTIVALVPIAGGLFDFCLAGIPLGYPLSGAKVRRLLAGKGF